MPILVQLNLEVITSITSIARRTTSHWQKICGCPNLIDFIALCDPSPNSFNANVTTQSRYTR